ACLFRSPASSSGPQRFQFLRRSAASRIVWMENIRSFQRLGISFPLQQKADREPANDDAELRRRAFLGEHCGERQYDEACRHLSAESSGSPFARSIAVRSEERRAG